MDWNRTCNWTLEHKQSEKDRHGNVFTVSEQSKALSALNKNRQRKERSVLREESLDEMQSAAI